MIGIFKVLVAGGLAAALVSAACAESCSEAQGRIDRASVEAESLIKEHPWTTAIFASCIVVGADTYKKTKDNTQATVDFGACALGLCIPTDSYSTCLEVNAKLFALALIAIEAKSTIDEGRCTN